MEPHTQTSSTIAERLAKELIPPLKRLDTLLERAVEKARGIFGKTAGADPFRGLHIADEEVDRLLEREPGAPLLFAENNPSTELENFIENGSRIGWLAHAFGMSAFDLDVLLVALAPELDLRYERLYAYLQDNVSRRRPSVDLALNLLCDSAADRLQRRYHFQSSAPLIRNHLLHLTPDPNQPVPPLLSHFFRLDEQIVNFILGRDGLDARLVPFCDYFLPDMLLADVPVDAELKQRLRRGIVDAMENGNRLCLYFEGPQGIGRRQTAEALAFEANLPLVAFDVEKAVHLATDFKQALAIGFRDAWFKNALILFENVDILQAEKHAVALKLFNEALARDGGITLLCGTKPWTSTGPSPSGITTVSFPMPDFGLRRQCWQRCLAGAGISLNGNKLDGLAGRFRLTPARIADAIRNTGQQARMDTARDDSVEKQADAIAKPNIDDLYRAARDQCGHDLAGLTQKVTPLYTWDDIVLPEDTLAQLREICQRVTHRHKVMVEWGFGRRLSLGKGANALFSGASGTGKTMAAEIIANELKLDLYKIDLSGVVSKYIGETEKNLNRIFHAAENANAILFFDEADALFGKRSEVRDSHDRYANIEISYLLQKMEEYDGLAILATNLQQNLDESFTRRLTSIVHFTFPDEKSRQLIWKKIWPPETPLSDAIELKGLAPQFKLSGGNIRNIALAAAFLSAEDSTTVDKTYLFRAIRREYQKMGKQLSDAELQNYSDAMYFS